MPMSQNGYKHYLVTLLKPDGERRFSDGSITSYCSGLNHISAQLGIDIWSSSDLAAIEQLIEDCSPQGQHAAVGAYGNQTAYNALKQWRDYVLSETQKSYLLTWNPANFVDGGDAGVTPNTSNRWTCHSQQPKLGDRVFLVRVGVEPRGIVASGIVSRESFEDADWRDPTQTRRYIEFIPDDIRPTLADGLLPLQQLELLNTAPHENFRWNPQSSGIAIPAPIASALNDKWNNTKPSRNTMLTSIPHNQILFGPPGTGKTYNVIDKALAILAPELLHQAGVDRATLQNKFAEFEKAGQVAFVTFHQSFSYEDFVEGLRAETAETGELNYRVVDGVFLTMCKRAQNGRLAKDDPFNQALVKLEQKVEQSEDGLLAMQTVKGKLFNASYTGGDTFLCYPASNPDLKHGYTGNLNSVREFYETGICRDSSISYVKGMLQYLKSNCGLPEQYQPLVDTQRKPFVLIIDEINRGNISRIFGELITLLESSKREGAAEALSVTLPYSRSNFAVPDNLYIIGTMNTADRSLAGLDLALRRRFTFIEMPPRPELLDDVDVGGVNIGALLRVINQRIAVLLDRDHCIGHAYFMPLIENNRLTQLHEIFKQKIIPLLQEYFFEDWQRIRWVLNDQNKADAAAFVVEDQSLSIDTLFRGVDSGLPNRKVWQLNAAAFDNIAAYQGIL
jgi:hypothetical protein